MNTDDFDAVLFDLDGVLTPTAEVHMRAWEEMFNQFLTEYAERHPCEQEGEEADLSPYTDADYFAHVDGKPRYEGVAAFLTSRGIDLPHGDPSDDPSQETVCGLGNRKNDAFNEVLERDGVQAYPGSVRLLEALAERELPMAIVSSSNNAPAVLESAGVAHFFSFVMHGGVASQRGIAGKPAPDTFVVAAQELGVTPSRSVVLEDALSGVQAGAAGHFGLVIGVDRGAGAKALTDAGATLVVADLEELL